MNKSDKKLRVGVIFGGRSGEHEVSLESARSVLSALDKNKYEVVQIGISKNGRWLTGSVLPQLSKGEGATETVTLLPDPQAGGLMQLDQDAHTMSLSAVGALDVVIPILHGTYGEDGTVQGLLELAGIPYVGAGVVGSATGMDKAIFKHIMMANDLPILPWRLVRKSEWLQGQTAVLDALEKQFVYPIFTKPANLGSSVGISKCDNREELEAGLNEAAKYDRRLIVEQGISVRELEVAVLGNDDPVASVVGEIRPKRDFYDYVAKYEASAEEESDLMIPAEISDEMSQQVREMAIRAYQAIDCAGLGRVDLLLDKETGALYLNEINTIPGFTNISMYPQLWQASGLPYGVLLDKLIALALERHSEKITLQTEYM